VASSVSAWDCGRLSLHLDAHFWARWDETALECAPALLSPIVIPTLPRLTLYSLNGRLYTRIQPSVGTLSNSGPDSKNFCRE